MGVATRAKKRRLEAEERLADRISSLSDDVLGDIVSLLPTKDGARTQVLSSRWRHIWRAAPLNLELRGVRASEISHVVSVHPGPGRRFVVPSEYAWTTLDGWLRSPALDNLQELGLEQDYPYLLPPSVFRFSSTLRVASFCRCRCTFQDGNNGGAVLLPVLESLTLSEVRISESSLLALLAGCPVLQSLCLFGTYCFPRLRIVSPSLRNISLDSYWGRQELVIEDAPCLETLQSSKKLQINISVISAPRLAVLGELFEDTPRLQVGTTVLQGSTVVSMAAAVHSVKVLSLSFVTLCLRTVINLLKCFPQLEKLYIKAIARVENAWYTTNPESMGTLNIRLRKIVLENYQGVRWQVGFVNFFLSNARALESLELVVRNIDANKWIAKQYSLLNIKSASSGARLTFVSHKKKLKNIKRSKSARVST